MELPEKINELAAANDEAITFDGYEDALIGICHQFGRPPVACYDLDKCLKILQERDGMTEEDALEFFDFNTLGCSVGDSTPVFIKLFTCQTNGHEL
jgi:hypothetical protein